MLVAAIPNTLWMMSAYVSISINKHTSIAIIYSLVAMISMIVAYIFTPSLGLLAIPVAILFSEITTLYFVLNSSLRIVQDQTKDFFRYLISNAPFRQVLKFKQSIQ